MLIHRRTLLIPTIVLALVASACSGDDDDTDTTADTEETTADETELDGDGLAIGYIKPPAGLFDLLGAAQTGALALAADDIAAGGGVLGGPLTIVEGEPEPARGAELVFDDLVEGGTNLIVGPSSSEEARLIIPKLADADAVVCGASTTAPGLPELSGADGRFVRTSFDDNIVALHAFDRIRERTASILGRAPQVTLVVRGDAYGDGISGSLAGLLGLVGYEVAVDRYVPENVLGEGLGERVAALGGDVIVIIGLEESPRFSRLMQEAGVDPAKMIGLDGLATPRFPAKAGVEDPALLDGLTVIGATGPIDFLTRLTEKSESQTEVVYGAQAYDCAIALALAVESIGSTDSGDVSSALREVTGDGEICTTYAQCAELLRAGVDIDYDGPSGPVDLTAEGEPGGGRFITARLTGGDFNIVADLRIALEEIRDRVAPRLAGFIGDIQVALTELGYYTGPIDGQQSDELTAAIAAFQTDAGLEPTGELDAATIAAIQDALAEQGLLLDASVTEVQQVLTELGYYSGPIDGRFTPELSDAIRAFQTDLGVEPTGILDAATLRAIFTAGVAAGEEVTPSTTPSTTTTTLVVTTTTAPVTTQPPATQPPATQPPATQPPATQPPTTVPSPDITVPPGGGSLVDILAGNPDLSELTALIQSAGVDNVLPGPGPYTIFAPTNDAIPDSGLPGGQALIDLLQLHVVDASLDSGAVLGETQLATLSGETVAVDAGAVTVGGAGIVVADLEATVDPTGFVHAVDAVLTAS